LGELIEEGIQEDFMEVRFLDPKLVSMMNFNIVSLKSMEKSVAKMGN